MKKTIFHTLATAFLFTSLSAVAFAQDEDLPGTDDATVDTITGSLEPAVNAATGKRIQSRSSSSTPDNAICSKTKFDNDKVHWCMHFTDRYANPYVLYHFHGLGGSEKNWSQGYTHELLERWKSQGLTPPTVISISFGKLWLLTQTDGSLKRYDLFINKLMPFFEAKLGSVKPSQRILLGESMGGFNASQVLVKNPTLFSRIAMHCPAVTAMGPFDPKESLIQYIARTGAIPLLVYFTKAVGMVSFKKEAQWLRHAPIDLAEISSKIPTRVYLSCGDRDEFGFDDGTADLADAIRPKVKELTYRFIPNGHHMTVDVPTMADFLSQGW